MRGPARLWQHGVVSGLVAAASLSGALAWATPCQDYSLGMRWVAGMEFGHSSNSDIAFKGDIAYVAMDRIHVLDVSDTTQPQLLDTLNEGLYNPQRIDVAGNHLVATHGAGPIEIFSAADPAQPQFVRSWQPPAYVSDLALVGDICYLACSELGLLVLYIADPTNPVSYGAVGGTDCTRVHYLSGHLYTRSSIPGGSALVVYSIADALHPAETYRWGTAVLDAVPSGTRLYATLGTAGIALFSLATPGVPSLLGSMDTSGIPTTGVGFGNSFFTLESSGSLITAYNDTGAPPWPAVGSIATAFGPDVIRLHSGYAFVPSADDLEVFDLSQPAGGVEPLGYLEDLVSSAMLHVAASDGYAYVSNIDGQTSEGLIQVIDIQDPAAPQRVQTISCADRYPQDLALGPDLLFVADGLGVDVIDIAEPNQAARLGRVDTPGISQQASVAGSHLLIADGEAGLQIAIFEDPTLPVIVGNLDFNQNAYGVAAMSQYALVLIAGGTLKVVDIENPFAPVEVGSLGGLWAANHIAVLGSHAYVDGDAEIYVVDLALPSAPALVGGAALPGSAIDLVASGDALYVASYSAGLQVLDIGDPLQPRLLGGLQLDDLSEGIATDGDLICVASSTRMNLAPLYCPTLTSVAEDEPAPAALALSTHPNPFNPSTRIRFALPAPGRVSLAVHDAAGRRLRSLLAEVERPAGELSLDWDGRTDGGEALPSGVYLLRLEAGDERASAKLTLLR